MPIGLRQIELQCNQQFCSAMHEGGLVSVATSAGGGDAGQTPL